MAELRWVLLVLGLVALVGVYIYTRYRGRPAERIAPKGGDRQEPVIHDTSAVGEGKAASDDAAGQPVSIPINDGSRIVTIRLMASESDGIPGEQLILALREEGLRHGKFGIFHRPDPEDAERALFSVASLIEPGAFDLTKIKTTSYPGISLFLVLPGPADELAAFDDMLATARSLAKKLQSQLLDEQGSNLSVQRERYLREEIVQFQHQGLHTS